MSTEPDPDRPCIAPLTLGPIACAYGHEHPHEVSHYAVGEADEMHWSLFWWNRAAVSERPGETASTRGHRLPPPAEPSLADRLRDQAYVRGGLDMCSRLIGEWPLETMNTRAAQSFIGSVQEAAEEAADVWQPSLATRLRELIDFADGEKSGIRSVHVDSLRALLEPEA